MRKSRGYWTKENLLAEGLKYETRIEFQKNSVGAYNTARKNGWLEEVCSHMELLRDPTSKIGKRYGYIIITGYISKIRPTDNKKVNVFEYICDCGNTGSFQTSNLKKKGDQKRLKASCGCNTGGFRDKLLLNESGFNTCFDCKQTLPISEFGKNKLCKNGLQPNCKGCKSKGDKKYREDPKFREYNLKRKRDVYFTIKKDPKRYDAMLKRQRETRDYRSDYITMRADPLRRAKDVIRKTIKRSLEVRDISKSKIFLKTKEILCCDPTYFKEHIESQFTEGMNWLNHGEWHLDHIIPMDVAKTVDELIKLNHWTNFQPLWAADNLSKSYYVLDEHHDLFYKLLGREFDKKTNRVK